MLLGDLGGPEWMRFGLTALAGGVSAIGVYSAVIGTRRLEVRRARVGVRGLPPDLEGLRIAILSDFHAGWLTPRSVLEHAVRRALASEPHLIALPGDLVDRRPRDLDRALDAMAGLHAPLGVWAVPGNHDRVYMELDAWQQTLSRHPEVRDLTNRYVLLRHGTATVCLAGVDDLDRGTPRLQLPPPDVRDFTILLAHNPDQAEHLSCAADQVDLVLSGHTHGGQIRLPVLGAVHRKSAIYDHGLYRRPCTQVYTSRGIGNTLLPLRLSARPEVAILELTAEHTSR